MSDVQSSIVQMLLGPILDAFVNRHKRDAAHDAGRLTFWRNGMLEHLQVVATEKATDRTFGALKREYEKSGPGLEKVIARLVEAREKLAGTALARQIDAILYSESGGKISLREEVDQLIHSWECAKDLPSGDPLRELSLQNIKEDAAHICKGIGGFNAEVERLNRMVRGA